jgi:inosine-uridine nucleoside N-ribohydrolase
MALLFLHRHPQIDLIGVTTVLETHRLILPRATRSS